MTSAKEARWAEEDRALGALENVNPDESDAVIAAVIADYVTMKVDYQPPYSLLINHDLSRATADRIARMGRNYSWPFPHGRPVPIRYDYQWVNFVGIKTDNRTEARRWAIEALLLGYEVSYLASSSIASGPRSIAKTREDRRKHLAAQAACKAKYGRPS